MKIVYCLNSICYRGGIERVTIVKANALADIDGNEVYIVVTDNKRDFRITALSPKVHLVDLHVNYYDDEWHCWVMALKYYLVKSRLHKRLLTQILMDIQPDIVVSVGQSEKFFLPTIRGRWKTVREFHFMSNYRTIMAGNVTERLEAYLLNFYEFHYKIKQYDKIVLLTQEDKKHNWKEGSNTEVIPNPLTIPITDAVSSLRQKRVVAMGRLVNQKNFSSLIRSFKYVVDKHPDWSLDIYGEGDLKIQLRRQIEELGLCGNISLCGATSDVREKMLDASCFVLSSWLEGFGLVLIEAMSCGLPVVSYNCPYGPSDIITDGMDGFLVPVWDEKGLADRICRIIEDEEMRKRMGQAAKETSEKYKLDNIIQMWMDLFRRLLAQKKLQ